MRLPWGSASWLLQPVLVTAAPFPHVIAAVMLPSRQAMDLSAEMWRPLSGCFAAPPPELWRDNKAGVGRRGPLTEAVTALIGTLGSLLVQLEPNDPESKGIVQRANPPVESS